MRSLSLIVVILAIAATEGTTTVLRRGRVAIPRKGTEDPYTVEKLKEQIKLATETRGDGGYQFHGNKDHVTKKRGCCRRVFDTACSLPGRALTGAGNCVGYVAGAAGGWLRGKARGVVEAVSNPLQTVLSLFWLARRFAYLAAMTGAVVWFALHAWCLGLLNKWIVSLGLAHLIPQFGGHTWIVPMTKALSWVGGYVTSSGLLNSAGTYASSIGLLRLANYFEWMSLRSQDEFCVAVSSVQLGQMIALLLFGYFGWNYGKLVDQNVATMSKLDILLNKVDDLDNDQGGRRSLTSGRYGGGQQKRVD